MSEVDLFERHIRVLVTRARRRSCDGRASPLHGRSVIASGPACGLLDTLFDLSDHDDHDDYEDHEDHEDRALS